MYDDDDVYPGIIIDVETHSIPVKCMHRNGVNKYFWTTPREDVSCYADDQLLCLLYPQALDKHSYLTGEDHMEISRIPLGELQLEMP
ncbi:hypothetical protein NHX12_019020 [Muraenolepis orangiensis]|uniref:Uncharacterized protein n=1 Tax=Muraenolepis orangiensis TaxID=630683 RepID=A0A9Q0ITI8_9TELE|nr:hypothetical protein NHX12_019020 [Muraenolepis orangiensis]